VFCNWTHVWVHSSYPEQKQDSRCGFEIKYIFFIYEQTGQTEFLVFCVMKGEEAKD